MDIAPIMARRGKRIVVCALLLMLMQMYVEVVDGQNVIMDTFNISLDPDTATFELDQPALGTISLSGSFDPPTNSNKIWLSMFTKNGDQNIIEEAFDWKFTTQILNGRCSGLVEGVERTSDNLWRLSERVKMTIFGPRAKCLDMSELCVRVRPDCETDDDKKATTDGTKCLQFAGMSGIGDVRKTCEIPTTDIRLDKINIEGGGIEYKSSEDKQTSVNVSFNVDNTGGKYIRNASFDISPYFYRTDGGPDEFGRTTVVRNDSEIPPNSSGTFRREINVTLPNKSCDKFTHLCLKISPVSESNGGVFIGLSFSKKSTCFNLTRTGAGQKKCLSEIKLSNFKVHNLKQGSYQINQNTNITFSADLVNIGPNPVIASTARNLSIVFVVLRLEGENGQSVGKTEISLKHDLQRNDSYEIRSEKAVVKVTDDAACKDNSSRICAGVMFDKNAPNYNPFSKDEHNQNIDCLKFGNDVDNGEAGAITCGSVIQWYHIVLLVLVAVLLLGTILFLCRCWMKRKRQTDEPIVNTLHDLQRPRSISLAHLYEDITSRLPHVRNLLRRAGTKNDENPYDVTIPDNTNEAFQPGSEDNPYDSKIPGIEGDKRSGDTRLQDGDSSSDTSIILVMNPRPRPSQPNLYIENASFIGRLCPLNDHKETISIQGLPTSESTDDLAADDSDLNFMPHDDSDKIEHETAVGSQAPSDAKDSSEAAVDSERASAGLQIQVEPPQKTPSSPKFFRSREHSLDIPLRMPPPIPSGPGQDSNSRFDLDHDLETRSSFPMIPNRLHISPASPIPDVNEAILDTNPDPPPNPDPDSDSNPDPKPNPVSEFPGSVPDSDTYLPAKPKLRPKPKLEPKPALKPKPGLNPHPDSGQSSGKIDPASDPTPNLQDTAETEDKPIIPPKPRQPPQPKEDQNSDPPLMPKLPKSPASSLKGVHVDPKTMEVVLEHIRKSQSKAPNRNALEIPPNSYHQETTEPTDMEVMQAVNVMEAYLALMAALHPDDDDYEMPKRPNLTPDVPTLDLGPLKRRKSYCAQLTLKRKSLPPSIYVNMWDKTWELKRAHLTVDRNKPLGEGQFGKVFKGVATGVKGRTGDVLVAVKELKDGADNSDKDEFLKELAIHTVIKNHPHVVELLGGCIRDEPICIVTEYLSGGDLLGFLRRRTFRGIGREMVWHHITKFGLHIARGMAYVAEREIVHRDLAARNILMTEDEVCKVSDFGFARDIFGETSYTKAPEKAPIRWYAPESVMDSIFTTKSDVWSFGILLFEIATLGKTKPYSNQSNDEVRMKVSAGVHPSRPPYCNEELFRIMEMCWRKLPEDRPTFSKLVDVLEGMQSHYPGESGKSQEAPRAPSPVNSEKEGSLELENSESEEEYGEESAL